MAYNLLTVEQLRALMLRSWQQAMIDRGIDSPDVSSETEIYVKCESIAKAILTAQRDFIATDKQRMPDTATGDDLLRWCTLWGVVPKAGAGSSGYFTFATSATGTTAIATGSELVDDQGQRFQVSTGGSYADDDRIAIEAVTIGSATNLAEGARLRWLSPPPSAQSRVTIYTGGLTGGSDPETESELRQRLQDTIANKPGSLNWSAIALIAEESDPSIQKAFVYPAYLGPNSLLVSVAQAPTETNRSRDVSSTILSAAESALIGHLPGWVDLDVVSVTNAEVNVSIGMSLADNQWTDSDPFPVRAADGYVTVASRISDSVITVVADAEPLAGITSLCWVSSLNQTLKRATVSSYSTIAANTYQLTLDVPFTGIAVGDWVFPDAQRMEDYVEALFTIFATMGPGELVNDPSLYAGLYPRAYRKPAVGQSWASDLGPSVLKFLVELGDEILDLDWLYRQHTSPSEISPQLDLGSAPRIFIPNQLGFYPLS